MRWRPAPVAALTVLVCLAAALAACGGGSGGTASAPTTRAAATVTTPGTSQAGRPPLMAIQDDRLVNADADLPERIRMIAATGAQVARVDVFWKDIAPQAPATPTDPADPAYRFGRLDTVVRGLAAHDVEPILVVFNAPAWASGGATTVSPTMPYNSAPPDPGAYAAFMTAIVTRYSGSFTADGAALPRVRHWEVWNEPNLSLFLFPQGGTEAWLDAYAELVRRATPAIRAAGGAGTVVLAGAAGPRGKTGRTAVGARDWLLGLRRRDIPLDAYSQHIYPSAGPLQATAAMPSWATLPVLMDDLRAWRADLPLFITEAGYTTAPTPYRKVAVTEEQQAAYLRDLQTLAVTRDPRLRAIVWFNLQDNANWPAGLIREDGSLKPSHAVFTALTRASRERRLP